MNKKVILLTSILFLLSFSLIQNSYAITATGGTITTNGAFTVHKFTANGTFTVTSDVSSYYMLIDYCIIAGGGSGGSGQGGHAGGGGGAGGVLCGQLNPSITAYPIVIGSGGVGSVVNTFGTNGGNSTAFGLLARGGGAGAPACDCGVSVKGKNGGNGGGTSEEIGAGGDSQFAISLDYAQGNDGGFSDNTYAGGGGSIAHKGLRPTGGVGLSYFHTGSAVLLNEGGFGGQTGVAGSGASAGANTGSGGGGGNGNGASCTGACLGGSGIVYIRYLTDVTPKLYVNELKTTANSTSSITLLWRQSFNHLGIDDSADGWKIEKESPVGGGFSTLISNTGNSLLTYTDNGLVPDTQYNYRVTPYNGTSLGEKSNESNTLTLFDSTEYRSSVLTLYSTIQPNGIVLDTNADSLSDQLYSYVTYGNTILISKELGNKNSTTGLIILPAGHIVSTIQAIKDIILIGSGYDETRFCKTNLHIFNITSGVSRSSLLTNFYDGLGGTAVLNYATGILGKFNEPVLHTSCAGSTSREYYVANSTKIIFNGTSATGGTTKGYNSIMSWSDIGSPSTTSVTNLNRVYTNFFPSSSTTSMGLCHTTDGCLTNSTGSPVFIKPVSSPLASSVILDPNVQLYHGGIKLPKGTILPAKNSLWSSYLPTVSSSPTTITSLFHFKILNTTLTTEPVRTIFSDATHTYVLYMSGTTVYYIPVTSSLLANRSVGYYLPDNNPDVFDSSTTSSALTSTSYNLQTPVLNYTQSNAGLVSTVSGYKFKPLTSLNRIVDSDVTDEYAIIPFTIGATGGNSEFSALIKNAPASAGVAIRDATDKFSGNAFNWNIDFLKADDTFTVSLPTNKCVDIFVRDITNDLAWVDLGNLCNSGSMPKTLVYSQNLSFTFWSLPYGVTHTYDNDVDSLVTQVRHDTAPYTYTVKIFDSNGVQQYNQAYTELTTTIDSQTHNASGISKPSMLKVFDADGNQIYYSTLGLPSYLSGSILWFNTWLEIDGFNLLFMLPIVFGAMFTRNTVGIGTMSTVALIATLTWFGIIPIPDIAMYLMIFIAVIGVIAYKKLYD